MKKYYDFEKHDIGFSDIACLVLAGCKHDKEGGFRTETLKMGGDGDYKAYIVVGEAEIGDHYERVYTFNSWVKIYDDHGLQIDFEADEINFYRAGEYGVIIQVKNNSEDENEFTWEYPTAYGGVYQYRRYKDNLRYNRTVLGINERA